MVDMPCQTILLDGALGTRLQQLSGNDQIRSPFWNIEKPEWVRQIHKLYLQAGSEILLTNTFGAQTDLEFEKAIQCVHDLSGSYRIAGAIGPTTSKRGAKILAAGVDLFVLETFSDLSSARKFISLLEGFGKPIALSFAWIHDDGFRLYSGETFPDVMEFIKPLPLFAVGANCNLGTTWMVEIANRFLENGKWDVWIKSNAGQPRRQNNRYVYDQTPENFASELAPLIGKVHYLGGCCGTDERFIQAFQNRRTLNLAKP
jgi:5-methyltetrahydrofolate--homocysteine methyltransferase